MKIFLSYASEQSELAKEIALALQAENHTVFFDRSSLAPSESYNAAEKKWGRSEFHDLKLKACYKIYSDPIFPIANRT